MCSMFVKADKSEFHATEVSFLRFANYYHRFICTYRSVAAPLTALSSQKVAFQWSSTAEKVFSGLKSRFSSAPILIFPDPKRHFVVEVDATDSRVGAVLSQWSVEVQKLHPCAFFSCKLSPAKIKYAAESCLLSRLLLRRGGTGLRG